MISRAERGEFLHIVHELAARFVYNPLVRENVEQMFLSVGPEAFIRQEKAMLQRQESFSILPLIHCPTLVIHAQEDNIFSLEEHEELITHIPHAVLATVSESGHMSPMEQPGRIAELLKEWLNAVSFQKNF